MSADLERFCDACLSEQPLWEELGALTDPAAFVARAVELGAARGLRFSAAEVAQALAERRREWIERWVQA